VERGSKEVGAANPGPESVRGCPGLPSFVPAGTLNWLASLEWINEFKRLPLVWISTVVAKMQAAFAARISMLDGAGGW